MSRPTNKPFVSSDLALEVRVHQFHADASTLGFAVGEWPAALDTNLGNSQPFDRVELQYGGGACLYRQRFGCVTLLVLND